MSIKIPDKAFPKYPDQKSAMLYQIMRSSLWSQGQIKGSSHSAV